MSSLLAERAQHPQQPARSPPIELVRKSFDCRRKQAKFSYVLDVALPHSLQPKLRLAPGSIERLEKEQNAAEDETERSFSGSATPEVSSSSSGAGRRRSVVIVGAGPAGLFAALSLSETRDVSVTLLERGRGVEERGRDIGALQARRVLNRESNFCFGEGGAGTWSDGKLTTRIGKNSTEVRHVLQTLVRFGAPENILVSGKPHLGTDRLVRLLRNMRAELQRRGVRVMFNARASKLLTRESSAALLNNSKQCYGVELDGGERLLADYVVLATGHSAADAYEMVLRAGATLSAKDSAMGFRIEHPQAVINELQYGAAFASMVQPEQSPKRQQALERKQSVALPVADYRVAAHAAHVEQDGHNSYSCYSFCMCPGGQIVPTSVNERELCVNGMSFSTRRSPWANSGLVVTVGEAEYSSFVATGSEDPSDLAFGALEFQRSIERAAADMGGSCLVAPAQRVVDFLNKRTTPDHLLPRCSYRPGIRSAPLHELYPRSMQSAFESALYRFDRSMSGYIHPDALLVAPETRTSSPVSIARDPTTLMATGVDALFPAGEGAGHAGGIVSAAVDGSRVANAIIEATQLSPISS